MYDSSRWVWAFVSAGRIAKAPRSNGSAASTPAGAGPDPQAAMRPASTATHPSRIGGAAIGSTQSARYNAIQLVRRVFFSAAVRAA